jgi:hypothetical protein
MHNPEYQIVWFNERGRHGTEVPHGAFERRGSKPGFENARATEHLPTYVTVRCSKTSNEGLGFPSSTEEIQAFFDVLDGMSTLVVICETI